MGSPRLALALVGLLLVATAGLVVWLVGRTGPVPDGGEPTATAESRPATEPPLAPESAPASALRERASRNAPAGSTPIIRGRVVDLSERPVTGAVVQLVADPPAERTDRALRTATSDASGAFAFRSDDQGLGNAFRVVVRRVDGYLDFTSEVVTWGREDLVLRLRADAVLEVLTVDEESGAVVDPCDVAVGFPLPPRPDAAWPRSGASRRWATVGRPRPGTVLLAPATPGEALFLLVPRDGVHARSVLRHIVSEAPFQPITLRVPRQRTRDLRILGPDQRPFANATFQLVQSEVPSWLDSMPTIADVEYRGAGVVARVRVQGGVTDAAGASFLMGARGVLYELVVDAPGVARQVFRDVAVDDALPPLTLAFAAGAELHGRIGPTAALQRMTWEDPRKEGVKFHPPTAWLAPRKRGASALAAVPLARDGSYRFRGLEPGSYTLRMYWYGPQGEENQEELATIEDLRSGERREVNPLLEHLVPATLRGRVLWNGAPLRDEQLELRGSVSGPGIGARPIGPVSIRTDADGRFVATVGAGSWRVGPPFRALGTGQRPWPASATPAVEVKCGVDTDGVFELRATKVALTLSDSGGAPLPGRKVHLIFESGGPWYQVLTDAQGQARFECVGLGSYHVDVVPDTPPSVRIGKLVLDGSSPELTLELRMPK